MLIRIVMLKLHVIKFVIIIHLLSNEMRTGWTFFLTVTIMCNRMCTVMHSCTQLLAFGWLGATLNRWIQNSAATSAC